jgi:hypothetical protein
VFQAFHSLSTEEQITAIAREHARGSDSFITGLEQVILEQAFPFSCFKFLAIVVSPHHRLEIMQTLL